MPTMGTHGSFIFRGYNPYIGGLKPSFFMVLGSKGSGCVGNFEGILLLLCKTPDPSKLVIFRSWTPAIQVQTLPLEGPMILGETVTENYQP